MILVNLLIHTCFSTVVGIDLGSDSIKVAVGSRFKPVHLVRNLYANEATPNIFTCTDKYHWAFGEGAIDQCRINPKSCIQNQRIPLDDKLYFIENSLKGYQITALSLIQIIHNVNISERITDEMKVVIAIPPSMTNREKSYLYSALTIAGINCIQFVTSTYAPIEVYVNEGKYGFTDNSAVLIDIGHEGVRVSAFEFDNSKIVQKFGLYNDNVGGKTIDNNLLNSIIQKYNIKLSNQYYSDQNGYNNDLEFQRNRFKLLAEIRKAREQLTVNTKATFDFQSKIITLTRKDIDDSSNEIKKVLNQMIQSLKQNNQNLLRSGKVQLLGGCSRILCLQEYISKILPNCKQLRSLDIISSVCMGACYIVDSEIQTKVQVHDALITTEVIMKTSGNVYKLFSYGNTENFAPVVRLNNVDPLQLFQIVDKNDNDQEFTRFTVAVQSNNYNNVYTNTIDLGFSLNYYLMPVPDQPMLIQQYGNQVPLQINYEKIGWEISPEELANSKSLIDLMLSGIHRRKRIEDYKSSIQHKFNVFGSNDWRNMAFNGICLYIDSLYNSCNEKSGNFCSDEKIESILIEFQSLAHYVLKIDDDSFRSNKNERQKAIDELYSLLEACKISGATYSDVELWIKTKLESASLKEIYEKIGTLKERGKRAQNSYFSNL